MRGGRHARLWTAGVLSLACACGAASIGESGGEGEENLPDAAVGGIADAASLPSADAPPPDARACVEGDARATGDDGTCYMLFTSASSYPDAVASCAALGGHLVTIGDATEQALVGELSAQLVEVPDAWLGGSDATTEGAFVWETGELFYQGGPILYSNFRTGEPNDSDPGCSPVGEDCVIIESDRPDLGYSWDDRCCASQYPYLCER